MKISKLILFIIFLLVLPIVSASFNCSLTSNINQCYQIKNSNISEIQRDQLLSSLLYNSTNYPDHELIFNYNIQIKVNSSIENLTIINSTYIKSAWLSLLTAMPSVLENNTLYVPENTFVLSDYNYLIEVPKNYISKNYPETKNGDCKTIHNLIENTSKLEIYVNNDLQGNNKLKSVNINKDSLILDKLAIHSNIRQDHYTWKQYCISKNSKGKCIKYTYKCEFKNTDYLKDSVILTDNISVKYYNLKPYIEVNLLDIYYNTNKLNFSAVSFDGFILNFNNSYYSEQKYFYSVEFIGKPFYVAVLKAEKLNINKINNLIAGDNNTLFVNDITECKVIMFNHFYRLNEVCIINYLINKTETKLEIIPFNYKLTDFLRSCILIFAIYLIYRIIKYYIVRSIEI